MKPTSVDKEPVTAFSVIPVDGGYQVIKISLDPKTKKYKSEPVGTTDIFPLIIEKIKKLVKSELGI